MTGYQPYSSTWHYNAYDSFFVSDNVVGEFPQNTKVKFTQLDENNVATEKIGTVSGAIYTSGRTIVAVVMDNAAEIENKSISNQEVNYDYLTSAQGGSTSMDTALINSMIQAKINDITGNNIISKLGYTPESIANKETTVTATNAKYPSSLAVLNAIDAAVDGVIAGATGPFTNLTDVTISSPTNGQTVVYNSTSQQWENQTIQTGGGQTVDSFGDALIFG